MLGFENYDEEYLFHRNLSLSILYLSPIVVLVLMGFRPPTYGKHVTVGKTEQVSHTEQAHGRDDQSSVLSTTSDVVSNEKSLNSSASSLTKRRGPSNNENTRKNTYCGTSRDYADGVNDNSYGAFNEVSDNKQQQKEEKHWLGPLLPARWSWVFFESPCWIWVVICLWGYYREKEEGEERTALPVRNQILLGWFTFHYLYRSLWYPLVMMKTTSARMPFGIVFFAWFYCSINGYLQARDLTKFSIPIVAADEQSSSSLKYRCQFWFGVLWIVIGFYINLTSDRILQKIKQEKQRKIALRLSRQSNEQREEYKNGDGGGGSSRYAVPYGGFFEYVSSPHYFGELMEWTGFFIASDCSLASFSFVVWTAANLIPRAIHTHKWYTETFVGYIGKCQDKYRNSDVEKEHDDDDRNVDYSQLNRKAIIPFIL